VADDGWWGIAPELSGALERLGWQPTDDAVRQVLPALARHGNAVVAVPPAPRRAVPALAGIAAAVASVRGRALILAQPALVEPLAVAIAPMLAAAGLRSVTALGGARAARALAAGEVDVLVTSPATALALHTRSALAIDAFTSVTLAWPEDWDADEATTLLLADISRESQRLILTSHPAGVSDLVERHARRALVVGFPTAATTPEAEPRSLRTLSASWHDPAHAITTVLELLDPAGITLWTADSSLRDSLTPVLAEARASDLVLRAEPAHDMVAFLDLPTPAELATLGAGRDVILMQTPGTQRYLARVAPAARPLLESGLIDRLRDRDAILRAEVSSALERRDLDSAAHVLAPLFEHHDPQAIAAACFALWRRDRGASAPATTAPVEAAPPPTTPVGGVATAKLWIGVGRRDEATTGDLVAVLIKEVGLPREAIGRIELRETFSLVEVPAGEAERVARSLTGLTVRRRKLSARVDRGAPGRPERGRGPRRP
jgi:ATP-dependent RNA helicase DeaD